MLVAQIGFSLASSIARLKPFEKETGNDHHLSWPLEVFFHILSFLSPRDWLSASKVCKSWHWALNEDSDFWKGISKKYIFESAEELYTIIANNMGKTAGERKDAYESVRKNMDLVYSDYKSKYDALVSKASLTSRYLYNHMIDNIKETKQKLQWFSRQDRAKPEIKAAEDDLRNKYEHKIIKLIFIFIRHPRIVTYLNTVNFSGFQMVQGKMDDHLEEMIRSVFSEKGKAIFEIVKNQAIENGRIGADSKVPGEHLAFPKYNLVSSHEPLKRALKSYLDQSQQTPHISGKKRHPAASD